MATWGKKRCFSLKRFGKVHIPMRAGWRCELLHYVTSYPNMMRRELYNDRITCTCICNFRSLVC